MLDENIHKMSEYANTQIEDVPTINILLCYLLYKIGRPVQPDQLYEIAMSTGTINYFYYQDSINYLKTNLLVRTDTVDGYEVFILEKKGIVCAKQLKSYVPKSYRDKLVLAALRYFAKIKYEQEIKIEYIRLENGYYTHVRCLDDDESDLMDLKLYAPDLTQAKLIGDKIMLDPSGFYGKVIELALSNEEKAYDLSDN